MIFRRSGSINKNQKGFTFIDMIIAIAITGIIGVGTTGAIAQVFNQSTQSSVHMTAIKQVENALYSISRDAHMAQIVATDSGDSGFPLDLSWGEWASGTDHQVTYSIEDGKLKRSHSINGGDPDEITVAQDINPDAQITNCELADRVLTLKITATVGDGSRTVSETGKREVIPRPSLE